MSDQQQPAAMPQTGAQGGEPDRAPAGDDRLPSVPLEVFATINRELAAGGVDVARAIANHQVAEAEWQQAVLGWTQQIRTDITVARRFNQLYTQDSTHPA